MFCILDIESSGGPFGQESMIEIAAFRYDGQEIVDQLISLVHPHRKVQAYVAKMTGINDKMLMRAPRFHEIAKRLLEITEEAIIVGHNVEFDYRMLRQEYGRLGYDFERKTLDTITLAKELMPDLPAYGLEKLSDHLGLYRSQMHRAESDARATLELFQLLQEKDARKGINTVEQSITRNDFMKDKVKDLLRVVKQNRGLFYLHDREGKVIYMGASDNIKAAVNRLFLADSPSAEKLRASVQSIKVEACGNWLVARIKRNRELEDNRPSFNRRPIEKLRYGIYADQRSEPVRLSMKALEEAGNKTPMLKAFNVRAARRAMRMYGRLKESDAAQVRHVLFNFPRQALYSGQGRKRGEKTVFVVEKGHLVGYLYISLNEHLRHAERVKQLINRYPPQEENTELLKLGILSGEFRPLSLAEEA